jgi:ClpP class serine protease
MSAEEIEPIAGGRVWTGRQAKDRGLVDAHGDFVDAVHQIAELCDLAVDDAQLIRTRDLFATSETYLPPQPETFAREWVDMLSAGELRAINGRPLFLMPMTLRHS